jgi:hypothetical protein
MGSMYAQGLAESGLPLETALHVHLQHNHYPPVPAFMIEPCVAAIDAYNDEDYDREITLPDGVSYKGEPTAPASAIVEQHHLDAFIDSPEEW